MGCVDTVGVDRFPRQGAYLGRRVVEGGGVTVFGKKGES